jgi:threonine-phosphate decarboxylase
VIRTLAGKFPSVRFVVDESFGEFVPESAGASMLGAEVPENVIVLRSLSPFYGLPGLRVGFMVASEEICSQVDRAREPWTTSVVSLHAAEALLSSSIDASAVREDAIAERERVRSTLSGVPGLLVFRSQTNFLLLKITKAGMTSGTLCERMLKQKMLIRNAAGFRGLDSKFVRVSIRTPQDNDRLIEGLQTALDTSKWK